MAHSKTTSTSRARTEFSGFTLGRLFGVEIGIDWSLTVIFVLILFSLATGWFPRWHPAWSSATVWASSFAAALLFFCSVLAHELSHALVGRRRGIPIRRITLFMFGGIAHMEKEPPSAGAEFRMAIIGPVTSIAIGVLALTAAQFVTPALDPEAAQDPASLMAQLGPLASVLVWLGFINVMLGVFNLLPGFPLDGGRVLRAGLWRATGDRRKATRWSSYVGRGFAGLLMAYGVFLLFAVGAWTGVWWILIGWFLSSAAKGSYQQLLMRDALEEVPVSQVMRSQLVTIPDDISVATLVEEYVMASDQHAFPVIRDDRLVGMVSLEDVRKVPREQWSQTLIAQIMTPEESLATLRPNDEAADALQQIVSRNVGQIPVVENGHLAGMIRREDILKWMSLHSPLRV